MLLLVRVMINAFSLSLRKSDRQLCDRESARPERPPANAEFVSPLAVLEVDAHAPVFRPTLVLESQVPDEPLQAKHQTDVNTLADSSATVFVGTSCSDPLSASVPHTPSSHDPLAEVCNCESCLQSYSVLESLFEFIHRCNVVNRYGDDNCVVPIKSEATIADDEFWSTAGSATSTVDEVVTTSTTLIPPPVEVELPEDSSHMGKLNRKEKRRMVLAKRTQLLSVPKPSIEAPHEKSQCSKCSDLFLAQTTPYKCHDERVRIDVLQLIQHTRPILFNNTLQVVHIPDVKFIQDLLFIHFPLHTFLYFSHYSLVSRALYFVTVDDTDTRCLNYVNNRFIYINDGYQVNPRPFVTWSNAPPTMNVPNIRLPKPKTSAQLMKSAKFNPTIDIESPPKFYLSWEEVNNVLTIRRFKRENEFTRPLFGHQPEAIEFFHQTGYLDFFGKAGAELRKHVCNYLAGIRKAILPYADATQVLRASRIRYDANLTRLARFYLRVLHADSSKKYASNCINRFMKFATTDFSFRESPQFVQVANQYELYRSVEAQMLGVSPVSSVFDAVSDVFNSFVNICGNAFEMVWSFACRAGSVVSNIVNAVSSLSGYLEQYMPTIRAFFKALKLTATIAAVVLLCLLLHKLVKVVGNVGVMIKNFYRCFIRFWNIVMDTGDRLPEDDDLDADDDDEVESSNGFANVEAQSFFSSGGFLALLTTMCAGFRYKEALLLLNNVGSLSRSLSFVDQLEYFAKNVINWIYFKFTDTYYFVESEIERKTRDAYAKIDELFYPFGGDLDKIAAHSRSNEAFCRDALDLITKFKQILPSCLLVTKQGPAFKTMDNVLIKYRWTILCNRPCVTSTRPCVNIMLVGNTPGCGKNHVGQMIIAGVYKLLRELQPEKYRYDWRESLVFKKPKDSEYWDGYNEDTFALMIDEFMNRNDELSRSSEVLEMMEQCDGYPVPLNIAKCEDKGAVFASHCLNVITCPVSDWKASGIAQAGAPARRLDIVLRPVYNADLSEPDVDKHHVIHSSHYLSDAWNYSRDPFILADHANGQTYPIRSRSYGYMLPEGRVYLSQIIVSVARYLMRIDTMPSLRKCQDRIPVSRLAYSLGCDCNELGNKCVCCPVCRRSDDRCICVCPRCKSKSVPCDCKCSSCNCAPCVCSMLVNGNLVCCLKCKAITPSDCQCPKLAGKEKDSDSCESFSDASAQMFSSLWRPRDEPPDPADVSSPSDPPSSPIACLPRWFSRSSRDVNEFDKFCQVFSNAFMLNPDLEAYAQTPMAQKWFYCFQLIQEGNADPFLVGAYLSLNMSPEMILKYATFCSITFQRMHDNAREEYKNMMVEELEELPNPPEELVEYMLESVGFLNVDANDRLRELTMFAPAKFNPFERDDTLCSVWYNIGLLFYKYGNYCEVTCARVPDKSYTLTRYSTSAIVQLKTKVTLWIESLEVGRRVGQTWKQFRNWVAPACTLVGIAAMTTLDTFVFAPITWTLQFAVNNPLMTIAIVVPCVLVTMGMKKVISGDLDRKDELDLAEAQSDYAKLPRPKRSAAIAQSDYQKLKKKVRDASAQSDYSKVPKPKRSAMAQHAFWKLTPRQVFVYAKEEYLSCNLSCRASVKVHGKKYPAYGITTKRTLSPLYTAKDSRLKDGDELDLEKMCRYRLDEDVYLMPYLYNGTTQWYLLQNSVYYYMKPSENTEAQMGSCTVHARNKTRSIANNCFQYKLSTLLGRGGEGLCWSPGGRTFVMCRHQFEAMDCGEGLVSELAIKYHDGGAPLRFARSEFQLRYPKDDRDLIFIEVTTKQLPQLPSMKSRLKTRDDSLNFEGNRFVRVHREVVENKVHYWSECFNHEVRKTQPGLNMCYTDVKGNSCRRPTTTFYEIPNAKGKSGDCSAVYVDYESSSVADVVGLHSSTWNNSVTVVPLYREDFPFLTGEQYDFIPDSYDLPDVPAQGEAPQCDTYAVFPGTRNKGVTLKKPNFVPTDSVYIPSPMYNDLEEFLEKDGLQIPVAPAALRNFVNDSGEFVKVHDKTFAKLAECSGIDPMPEKLHKIINDYPDYIIDGWLPSHSVRRFQIIKFLDALFSDEIPGLESMDPTKSATYENKIKNKKRSNLFGRANAPKESWIVNDKGWWVDPDLTRQVNALFEHVEKGGAIKCLADACWKDELRLLEAVELGKTRLFCVGSFTLSVVTKMAFGDLVREKGDMFIRPSKIGINPYSIDWKHLKDFLSTHPNLFGGDCSGWDYRIRALFLFLFHRFIDTLDVFDHHRDMMHAIADTVVGVVLVYKSQLLERLFGVCSGHWLTSYFNTFANYCAHRIVWCYNKPEGFEGSFEQHVKMVFFGDDNGGCCSDVVRSWFNMSTIRDTFALMGMGYTTPNKKEVTDLFLDWESFSFLSRTFRKCPDTGTVFAPLNIDSIYGMLAWIKNPKSRCTDVDQLSLNVELARWEFVEHGKKVFEHHDKLFVEVRSRVRFTCPWPSYQEMLETKLSERL